MGADVTVLEMSPDRMRELDDLFLGRIKTIASNPVTLEEGCRRGSRFGAHRAIDDASGRARGMRPHPAISSLPVSSATLLGRASRPLSRRGPSSGFGKRSDIRFAPFA